MKKKLYFMECPFCKEQMVPFREPYEDGSGWMFGCLCECSDEIRDKVFKRSAENKLGE